MSEMKGKGEFGKGLNSLEISRNKSTKELLNLIKKGILMPLKKTGSYSMVDGEAEGPGSQKLDWGCQENNIR